MSSRNAARSRFRGLASGAGAAARRPLGEARLRREIARAREPLRFVIGAGNRPIAGWINTDVGPRARLHMGATRRWPGLARQRGVRLCRQRHRALRERDARKVLRQAWTALRLGGMIRLATPDVERTARMYLNGGVPAARHMERHRSAGYEIWHLVDLLRVTFVAHGHHEGYLWDFASLASELAAAGFTEVARRECGASPDAELCNLDQRDGSAHDAGGGGAEG